ncbi:tetratricopeptide repeat protein [Streptomyces specialis]|uniref:tetratricopeptide repeat protein n=1 Tax=Streptomyces specialis TaxID=498367 RepID=UPI00073EF179|nr:tetratricopeptide repeat protein [Streptomyces specialis]
MEIALELRDRVLEGYWLITLGDAQQALGRFEEALTSYHRAATLHRRLGDRSREALAWQGTGQTYRRLGRDAKAAAFHRHAAAVFRELKDGRHEALALDGLAGALLGDDPGQARRLWADALPLLAEYRDLRAVRLRDRIERQADGRLPPPGPGSA